MLIERTTEEVVIRLPSYEDTEGLELLVDYLSYKERTGKSKAKQSDVDRLAKKAKKAWWPKNRNRLKITDIEDKSSLTPKIIL